jgi:glycosyltransferase involved in cell wall biosynthesis
VIRAGTAQKLREVDADIACEAGIGKRVVFTGQLSQNEVIDLFAASNVLAMPKIDHPMNRVASPIKIAEYMAAHLNSHLIYEGIV